MVGTQLAGEGREGWHRHGGCRASPWRMLGITTECAKHRYGGCCSTMLTAIAVEDAGPSQHVTATLGSGGWLGTGGPELVAPQTEV